MVQKGSVILSYRRRNSPAKLYKCCLFTAKGKQEHSFLGQRTTAADLDINSIPLVQYQEPNVGIMNNFKHFGSIPRQAKVNILGIVWHRELLKEVDLGIEVSSLLRLLQQNMIHGVA